MSIRREIGSSDSFVTVLLFALFLSHRLSFLEGARISKTVTSIGVRIHPINSADLVLTKNRAFAKNVYEKMVHPIHPPVPFPPFEISLTSIVAITPTNL